MSAFELVELEPVPGRRTPVEGEVTVGRHECVLTIASPQVSRHHASVEAAGGGLQITDHGSRNGTFVNDRRVAGSQALSAGDRVRIGETTWEVAGAGAAAPTELEARGDVPVPDATVARAPVAPAVAAPAAAPAPAPAPVAPPPATPMPAGGASLDGGGRPRASAARRMEATLICYAVVVLTAIAVVLYLIIR